jgi:hypothetical protein
MTQDEQRAYQVRTAEDIQRRARVGDPTLTQAEIDFAGRVLGKRLGYVPNKTTLELVGESISEGLQATGATVGNTIRNATAGWLWPLAIVAAVVAAFWFFGGRAK